MTEGNANGIQVRQVTNLHANWSEQGEGQDGKFSLQLILDNGAEERVIRPNADDADAMMDLIEMSDSLYFDLSNGVFLFRDLA
jgi:hypothetical protein